MMKGWGAAGRDKGGEERGDQLEGVGRGQTN